MNNRLAIWLFGLIVAFALLDAFVLGWDSHLIIMRKLFDLIQWMAFWR